MATMGPATASTRLTGTATKPGHIYWTNEAGSIGEANLDGSDPHTIITAGADSLYGLAAGKAHIYWISNYSIWEANPNGGDPHPIVTRDLEAPIGVAVNSTHLYWADQTYIGVAKLSGSDPRTIISTPDGVGGVAVNSRHLYFSGGINAILEADLNGTDPHTIITGQHPDNVAVSAP
jgi:hypothetical protein